MNASRNSPGTEGSVRERRPGWAGRGGSGPRGTHDAFTLVEALVVIAIVGLLAGLLVPGLARARGLGQSTSCLGNLRQVGVALQVYVQDNGNRMPVMRDRPLGPEPGTNPFTPSKGVPGPDEVLLDVLGNTQALRCAGDRQRIFERTGSSYAWNSLLNGQDADRLKVMSLEFEAHEVPVFFDKEGFHRFRGARHAVNYLYADGHIRNLLVLEGAR